MPNQKNKKSSKKTLLIIGIIFIAIVIIASTSYLIYSSVHKNSYHNQNFRQFRNFTLDNETLNQTVNYFNNATDIQSMISYCQGMNMFYCRYYCTQINPSNSFCSGLPQSNFSRNYSMTGGQQ